MEAIPIEEVEKLNCVQKMHQIKKQFALKRENRKLINTYLNYSRNKSFEEMRETFNPSTINIEIVSELLSEPR